jgi:hypothetical protein
MFANIVADSLGGEGGVFASDDDPELVREAIPFGLKTIEALIQGSPENEKLLLAAASGFAQYAYGFVLPDAEEIESARPDLTRAKKARAKRLLARAVEYGMRGLEARHAGFRTLFATDRAGAPDGFGKDDVPLLYWTGAALGALVSLSKDDMAMLGRLPEVEALMGRALSLDEGFGDGAIHEFFVSYYGGRSESMGGSLKKAREHLERALALSNGKKIGVLVAWAEVAGVQKQDRKLFDEVLARVLEFNADEEPRFRLDNLIAQRRARILKSRAPELFLED